MVILWRELQAAARIDLVLPEVVAERCVHRLVEKASCRACVDACPRDAWILDEEMLGIDTDRCDGCDLCVPACPQGAIQGRYVPALNAGGGEAFIACENAGVEAPGDGLIPCLHALGTADLLRLRKGGACVLVTCCGDCESCDRGGARRLAQRLEEAGRLLASRGIGSLKHRSLKARDWETAIRRARGLAGPRRLDRRAFLRNAIKVPEEYLKAASDGSSTGFRPTGMWLDGGSVHALFPFVPEIDPARCNGCDACLQLCPQEAIRLDQQGPGSPAFLIDAERCSGCGICTDICEQDAVSVATMCPSTEHRIPLHSERCTACGADFHVPAVTGDGERTCRVCRKVDHCGALYQVLV